MKYIPESVLRTSDNYINNNYLIVSYLDWQKRITDASPSFCNPENDFWYALEALRFDVSWSLLMLAVKKASGETDDTLSNVWDDICVECDITTAFMYADRKTVYWAIVKFVDYLVATPVAKRA